MRRCRKRVRFDVVVGVAKIVWHEADDRKEDNQDHGQREKVFHHKVWPEGQCVFLCFFFRTATNLNTGWVVVASRVERPDVHDNQTRNYKREQVVKAEETVQCCVINRWPPQKQGLDRFADERHSAEQAGDNSRTPEGHLAPWQNVAHERRTHHQQIDQHADDPRDLAWCLIGTVVQAAEDVSIYSDKEQRSAVCVHITQHIAAIHVTHDVFNRGKRLIDMRCIVHCQNDAPDPHPVQVLGCRDHQCVIQQPNNRQAAVQPLFTV